MELVCHPLKTFHLENLANLEADFASDNIAYAL